MRCGCENRGFALRIATRRAIPTLRTDTGFTAWMTPQAGGDPSGLRRLSRDMKCANRACRGNREDFDTRILRTLACTCAVASTALCNPNWFARVVAVAVRSANRSSGCLTARCSDAFCASPSTQSTPSCASPHAISSSRQNPASSRTMTRTCG